MSVVSVRRCGEAHQPERSQKSAVGGQRQGYQLIVIGYWAEFNHELHQLSIRAGLAFLFGAAEIGHILVGSN
jgi:hypothetical protein